MGEGGITFIPLDQFASGECKICGGSSTGYAHLTYQSPGGHSITVKIEICDAANCRLEATERTKGVCGISPAP